MTHEADRDIRTMLALLELEGLGAPANGSTPEGKWFPDTRAYLEKRAQSRRDKASLVAEVAELKQKVKKVEKERDDARAEVYKAGVDRDNALAQLSRLKADIAREKARKEAAEQAAWEKEIAENRAKRAVEQEVERAREAVVKARQEAIIAAQAERSRTQTAAQKLAAVRYKIQQDARADRANFDAPKRNPEDAQLEADLIAEVEAEEREKIERRNNETEAERETRERDERRWDTDYLDRY
jgi:hypothetical protein